LQGKLHSEQDQIGFLMAWPTLEPGRLLEP